MQEGTPIGCCSRLRERGLQGGEQSKHAEDKRRCTPCLVESAVAHRKLPRCVQRLGSVHELDRRSLQEHK